MSTTETRGQPYLETADRSIVRQDLPVKHMLPLAGFEAVARGEQLPAWRPLPLSTNMFASCTRSTYERGSGLVPVCSICQLVSEQSYEFCSHSMS